MLNGWYLLAVVSGSAYWISGGVTAELPLGSSALVIGGKSAKGGRLLAPRDGGCSFQWILIRPNEISGVLSAEDRIAIEKIAANGITFHSFDPKHEIAIRASKLFDQMDDSPAQTRVRILDIFLTILETQMRQPGAAVVPENARARMRAWLDGTPESEIMETDVEYLAIKLGCSVRHFSRLFTELIGMSFRDHQTQLRMKKAGDLLLRSNSKVIEIAQECGYNHLGLFNSLFRRHFGESPSSWRRSRQTIPGSAQKRRRRGDGSELSKLAMAAFIFGSSMGMAHARPSGVQPSINAYSNHTNSAIVRSIQGFDVVGNTLLSPETMHSILSDFHGRSLETTNVIDAVKALQLVYQGRGFATVAISVPKQSITNGVVRLVVTEGRLNEIRVTGNHWFSESNVRRALPDLHTNLVLNSKVFQQELNRANNNSDRQIYPLIQPGSEPGTSRLVLNVTDQIPLHGRFELNNQYTPGTPELRGNASVQYNNLWQREHAIGLQYGFALQDFKAPDHSSFIDRPLIANYSGYYRLPLSTEEPVQAAIDANPQKFGYNEATRRFVLPPSQGRTDLTIYANRSTTDTGVKVNPVNTINPPPIGLYSTESGQDVSITEAIGFRVGKPLQSFLEISSTLSVGMDLKNFQRASFNTNDFLEQFTFLNPDTYQTQTNSIPFSNVQPPRTAHVSYLPVSIRWDAGRSDAHGTTTFGIGMNANVAGGAFSDSSDFRNTAGSTNSTGNYVVLQSSASRLQKLPEEWSLLIKADGQWANEPLISNEQLGMGGLAGVRGYLEGERYGDTGWRFTLEPRTPMLDIGMVDGTMPMRVQGAFFMDYGRSYSLNPLSSVHLQTLWGAGMGLNAKVGSTFDFRCAVAWALRDAVATHAGELQVYFAVAAQF